MKTWCGLYSGSMLLWITHALLHSKIGSLKRTLQYYYHATYYHARGCMVIVLKEPILFRVFKIASTYFVNIVSAALWIGRYDPLYIKSPCKHWLEAQPLQHWQKWNESGFRPPLCTYRLNWARRTPWGWWDDWDDTVLQTLIRNSSPGGLRPSTLPGVKCSGANHYPATLTYLCINHGDQRCLFNLK